MAEKTYRIVGKVVYRESDVGAPGFLVELWDKDLILDDFLGRTETDAEGGFAWEFEESYFRDLGLDPRPDLFFKVKKDDELVPLIGDHVLQNLEPGETVVAIEVDLAAPEEPEPVPDIPHRLVGRLLNEDTAAPLGGFRVKAFDLDADPEPQDLGEHLTDGRGYFAVVYFTPAETQKGEAETAPQERKIEFHVLNPDGEEIFQTEAVVTIDQEEVLELLVPIPEEPTPTIEELAETCQIEIPAELSSFLAEKGITHLGDIRNGAGIGHMEGLPVSPHHQAVLTLEAHARLSALTKEIELNQKIINKGYSSAAAIAQCPRAEFVTSMNGDTVDLKSARLHVEATAQTNVLRNLLAQWRADQANGLVDLFPDIIPDLPIFCICRECRAAVSPLAYLADLLRYALDHLRGQNEPISLAYLQNTFYQPFSDLPASCEQVQLEVRQMRIFIEVLWRYLMAHPRQLDYRMSAYQSLLNLIGTSYEEIRMARNDRNLRTELATRLGIELTTSDEEDEIQQLFLDPDVTDEEPHALTEKALEKLFGLKDFRSDPLSEGAKLGDPQNYITRWNLKGFNWSHNTDMNGSVHVSILQADGALEVNIYGDREREQLVASGTLATTSGTVNIHFENNSHLTGTLVLHNASSSDQIEISLIPYFVSWRLNYLRTLWQSEDWPIDAYDDRISFPGDIYPQVIGGPLPVIDPDVIGPDDMRRPKPGSAPFDLWVKRRHWVDMQLDVLAPMTLEDKFNYMYTKIVYDGPKIQPWKDTSPDEFDGIYYQLTHGTNEEVAKAQARIWNDLCLTVDSFTRLMEITNKDLLWHDDQSNEPVSDSEWREVDSILVRAQKERLFSFWRFEERPSGHQQFDPLFGPEHFWISVREPEQGDWPPVIPPGHPLIDPELLEIKDLPEPTAGGPAVLLWDNRRTELEDDRKELEAFTQDKVGFEDMLRHALGHPNPGDDLPHVLDELLADLQSGDPDKIKEATEKIENDLYMTVHDFEDLMELRAILNQPDPPTKPPQEKWAQVYSILTTAQKVKRRYPAWKSEEADLDYWTALKARMPAWRVMPYQRYGWQEALKRRSKPPIIDPDLLSMADFVDTVPGNAALDLWEERRNAIQLMLVQLASSRSDFTDMLEWFRVVIDEFIGISEGEFVELAGQMDQGLPVASRLEQLGLTRDAFSYLVRMREVVEAGEDLLDKEWEQVDSILTQVYKSRRFGQWNSEEKEQTILLGPDHFGIPTRPEFQFPPPEPVPLPAWRANWRDRRDWQDLLKTRIEQVDSIIEAMKEAISSTERTALPILREALVKVSEKTPKWLTDQLLIDSEAGACQKTTRIAQAIATLQVLLFSVRTGQLQDTHPDLSLEAEDFDEEWKWIGSYANWRAAMFVFTYPENVLYPHLKRWKTGKFDELVKQLAGASSLTPEKACEIGAVYSDYFRDMCRLEVKAAVQANTAIREGACRDRTYRGHRDFIYLFGHAADSKRVYFSRYDPEDESGYAQSFWKTIRGFDAVDEIIGVTVYHRSSQERHIYFFARRDGKLEYTKYDLEIGDWNGEVECLDLPNQVDVYSVRGEFLRALVKQERYSYSPPYLVVHLKSGLIYGHSMNREGDGWADHGPEVLSVPAQGSRFSRLNAMIDGWGKDTYLFASNADRIWYRVLGGRDDGLWRDLTPYIMQNAVCSFCGGFFLWTPSADRFYAFWTVSVPEILESNTHYRLIEPSDPALKDIDSLEEFDQWLEDVSGVSLASLSITLLGMEIPEGEEEWSLLQQLLSDMEWTQAVNTLEAYIDSDMYRWVYWKGADAIVRRRVFVGDELWKGYTLPRVLRIFKQEEPTRLRVMTRGEELGPVQIRNFYDLRMMLWAPSVCPDSVSRTVCYYVPADEKMATSRPYGDYQYLTWWSEDEYGGLEQSSSRTQVAMRYRGDPDLLTGMTYSHLWYRRYLLELAFEENRGASSSILTYLEEAGYFVPVHIAIQLNRRRQFKAALDLFRTVYDYSAAKNLRIIYPGLAPGENEDFVLVRDEDWLLDPLNPHAIALQRSGAYLRFTILSLVQCFLEFADAEFTIDTAESLPRARTLYMTALELLDLPELKQKLGACDEIIIELTQLDSGPLWGGVIQQFQQDIGRLNDLDTIIEVTNEVEAVLQSDLPTIEKLIQARATVGTALERADKPEIFKDILQFEAGAVEQVHLALLANADNVAAVRRAGKLAGTDFVNSVEIVSWGGATRTGQQSQRPAAISWLRLPQRLSEGSGTGATSFARGGGNLATYHAPGGAGQALPVTEPTSAAVVQEFGQSQPHHLFKIVSRVRPTFIPHLVHKFCVPPNPIIRALRLHAELNLFKLRNCRNIAGMEREIAPYAAPTDVMSGMPDIGADGQLTVPTAISLASTPYRHEYLLRRAKELADRASQMESAFLAALEKRDAEYYNLMKARQDIQLARAGVKLQDLRYKEAEDGVVLAELQRDRAVIQADHYANLLQAGLIDEEFASLALMALAANMYAGAALAATFLAPASVLQSAAQAAQSWASLLSQIAAYERRRQEWEFQLSLAQHDMLIGDQGVTLAKDRVRVVAQERNISLMQTDFAEATADFLANKFTNFELYDWMSSVLEGLYGFFLQETTAAAKLAEAQLAFERGMPEITSFIQADYWEALSEDAITMGADGGAPERRGLTGSARLTADIYRLEQYRLETEQRKLQLTKTVSLGRIDPYAFQRFRQTGVLLFATPMELFDRDFPGHYHRLIKRVRTSVIALIPPIEGVHATLSAVGFSRIVRKSDWGFEEIPLRRAPESVSLTSPREASGMFELVPQPQEIMIPFEGMGVATNWEFRMPKASNQFDYRSIADVLFTIEYTALDSFDYRQQVLQRLDTKVSADRPFSFRHQLPDQWFDLHNPDQTPTPMLVRFKTRREDFPPNLEAPKISHVLLYFARATEERLELEDVTLRFFEGGHEEQMVSCTANTIEGVISSRQTNAGGLTALKGKSVIGEWELELQNNPYVRSLFDAERIEDILFVITYSGDLPPWPE